MRIKAFCAEYGITEQTVSIYTARPELAHHKYKTGNKAYICKPDVLYKKITEMMKSRNGGHAYEIHIRHNSTPCLV